MEIMYIYGMGRHGLDVYFTLKENMYQGDIIFIDKDEKKHVDNQYGIKCISLDALCELGIDGNVQIIISNKESESIKKQLKQRGFTNLISWDEKKKEYSNLIKAIKDKDELKKIIKCIKNKRDKGKIM